MPHCPHDQSDRFAEANRLLQAYAALAIHAQTGKARDPDAEQTILACLRDALNPGVEACVTALWPPIPHADGDAVTHEFWALFLAHIRRKRKGGQSAVQIHAVGYLRCWVKYAAGSRGPEPLNQLNCALHACLKEHPDEWDYHRAHVLVALERCCKKLLAANHAQGQLPIPTAQEVAHILFNRVTEGLWNTHFTPICAKHAEDLGGDEQDGRTAGLQLVCDRGNVRRYVHDWDAFRAEAWPLLFGDVPPPGPGPGPTTSPGGLLLPEKYHDTVKKLIEKRFSDLDPDQPVVTFRRLCCLLFLGYYRRQGVFCDEFGMRDSCAVRCKGFWLEPVADFLAGGCQEDPQQRVCEEDPQQILLRLYTKHEHYGLFLDCLHRYGFIACTTHALCYLKENPAAGVAVLFALWDYCFKEKNTQYAGGAPVRFVSRVGEPPLQLVFYQDQPHPPVGVSVENMR